MLHTFKQILTGITAVMITCLTFLSLPAKAGLDSYEIYLNNKRLLKQYINQPLSLQQLQLEKAAPSDQLTITYSHCHNPNIGTNRHITVKNEKGEIVKQWNFPNGNAGMIIPVGELQQLERKYAANDLRVYYSADQLKEGYMLVALHLGKQRTSFIPRQADNTWWMATWYCSLKRRLIQSLA